MIALLIAVRLLISQNFQFLWLIKFLLLTFNKINLQNSHASILSFIFYRSCTFTSFLFHLKSYRYWFIVGDLCAVACWIVEKFYLKEKLGVAPPIPHQLLINLTTSWISLSETIFAVMTNLFHSSLFAKHPSFANSIIFCFNLTLLSCWILTCPFCFVCVKI